MRLIRESLPAGKSPPPNGADSPLVQGEAPQNYLETRSSATRIRTLIADDEPLAREVLRALLRNEPDIEIVGSSGTGPDATAAINELHPDLVFLDVHMPEWGGFEVLSRIRSARKPIVVFVTGNEQFAARAFEVHAADYLVKPCRRDLVRRALKRVRARFSELHASLIQEKLDALLAGSRPERAVERIIIKSGCRIVFLRLAEIDWVEAADNYVNLHAGAESHRLRETMNSLEARLPQSRFLRISRSAIVNVEHIKELQPMFHGEYVVRLRNDTRLTLTRGYRENLRQLCLI